MTTTVPVDRATASTLNPLVSSINTSASLEVLSRMVSCLGFLLSQIDQADEGRCPEFGNLYLLFETIAAALAYESDNPRIAVKAAESEVCHG